MKRLLPAMLFLLTGCGGTVSTLSTTEHPKYERMPPAVANPSVLIVGDNIVNAWCSATLLARNPTWACQGSPAGVRQETTTEVLARFPAAVFAHPKTIVIEAGIWDINADAPNIGMNPCNVSTACANIQAMITEATNAGIAVIVCTIPPWAEGPAATEYSDSEFNLQHGADIGYFNQFILATPSAVDIYTPLAMNVLDPGGTLDDATDVYNPLYTDDGVGPNTAGGQVMTQALQKALASPNVNQAERKLLR